MKYRIRNYIADTLALIFIVAIAFALPAIFFAWAGR